MRWRTETGEEKKKRKEAWKVIFAWWPIKCYVIEPYPSEYMMEKYAGKQVYDRTVWLERVARVARVCEYTGSVQNTKHTTVEKFYELTDEEKKVWKKALVGA
jgi:hypothetical protein